jgi:hypothetical protein
MQPISSQQSTPPENSQPYDTNVPDNNNANNNNINSSNHHHDNKETEGDRNHLNDLQPIEAIYEGGDTFELTSETIHNITPTEESNVKVQPKQTVTRSGRVSRMPRKYDDYVSYSIWIDHTALQATNDPDTLYYHQVLNEPDKDMFITAMENEIKQHNDNQNWVPVKRSTVPSTSRILPSVWSMRRK